MNFILFGIKVLLYEETHNFETAYMTAKYLFAINVKFCLALCLKWRNSSLIYLHDIKHL